ncbi:MAG: GDSL-type esterase/lipase family protein [Planctomycetota bacterium]|jgi:Fe-S-cluster formation regulator IscX/YfhJ|nr:GDSL-type esterase/lipase family protein [Planctomycetota bacterium]
MTTIMCMGDSITKGPEGGYRRHLAGMLAEAGLSYEFVGAQESCGLHEGYPGFRIEHLIDGRVTENWGVSQEIGVTLERFKPQQLLLMVGTNNLYEADPAVAFASIKTLIDRCLQHELALFVGSILPVRPGPKPWDMVVAEDVTTRIPAYNGRIAGYLSALRDQGRPVHFVDVYSCIGSLDELGDDGVHPREETFEAIARCWFDALIAATD